jgi:tetratricopeptide (TPR) repeat protein
MLQDLIDLLEKLREKDAAITLLNALSNHAETVLQYDELSRAYFKLKRYESAIITCELAYKKAEYSDQEYAIRTNLINLYNHANYPDKALELINILLEINPNDIDIILEKAFSLFLLNEKDDAEKVLLKYKDDPSIPYDLRTKIRFNLGTYALYRDDFIEGLKLFLLEGEKLKYWRKEKSPLLQYKFWDDDSLDNFVKEKYPKIYEEYNYYPSIILLKN